MSMTKQAKGFDLASPLAAEALRIEAIKVRATPPEEMAAAPVAPARGPQVLIRQYTVDRGGIRKATGARWQGADVFDLMERRARQVHEASGTDAPFIAPFTPGQIAIARHYRHLTERHDAGAVKCSALDGRTGGGSGRDWMDGYIAIGDELARLHARIGSGEAMSLRRVRPSKRDERVAITDRALVDAVCLGGMTLTEVLRRHGWARKVEITDAMRLALAAALDRMQGYR